MEITQIKELLKTDAYSFLWENEHLGNKIILLGLGGSHAYGMDKEDSDVDIRGIALNKKEEILLGRGFEQVENAATDTVVYSFNKMIKLLTDCNPNTIELMGLRPEHYLYVSDIGQELLDRKRMFLSQRCVDKFLGYANAQARRLENKSTREQSDREFMQHILDSIKCAEYTFKERYCQYDDDQIKLYVDKAIDEEYDTEIFLDIEKLQHYPLTDFLGLWSEMKSINTSYTKMGKRNKNALIHEKIDKHSAHLLRLYMMGIDLLEKEEIITYRVDEHDLLMDIRNGKYLDNNKKPNSAYYDILNEYQKRFDYAKENTSLPLKPDYKAINEFVMEVNEQIVRGEI